MLTTFRARAPFVICAGLIIATNALAEAPRPNDAATGMQISRRADQTSSQGPAAFFTGKATVIGLFQRPAPSRLTGATARFEPGARTAWHSHPLGQTLFVTEGVGWTQLEGGPKVEFEAGDVIWCPPNRKHWHGATPRGPMAHIAIQESLDGKNVTWMELVTQEEYLKDTLE